MTDIKETIDHTDRNVSQTKAMVEELNAQPTNVEILEVFHSHAEKDQEFQTKQEKVNVATEESLTEMKNRLKNIPDEVKTAEIVEAVIHKTLLNKGKLAYTFTLGLGAFAAAVVAIFTGIKVVLALIGLSYFK